MADQNDEMAAAMAEAKKNKASKAPVLPVAKPADTPAEQPKEPKPVSGSVAKFLQIDD